MCKDSKKNTYTEKNIFPRIREKKPDDIADRKRQWAKAISQHFSIKLAMNNPKSPLKKAYDNTYHCANVKQYDGDKMRTTYCKNRWCFTCNRIRTAININNYAPQISEMGVPFFVTLTRPTCELDELQERIKEMEKVWRQIYKYSKKPKVTAESIYLRGLRKMECTLRPDNKYHYHFHIIVDGWHNAEWIRSEWLNRNPDASHLAQDVRPADTGALLEVLKYTTKMSVKMANDTDFERLDKLFLAMKGKRTLAAFGGLKTLHAAQSDEEDFDIQAQADEELKLRLGNEESVWKWDKSVYDWVNVETGELLIGEDLPEKIKEIIQ